MHAVWYYLHMFTSMSGGTYGTVRIVQGSLDVIEDACKPSPTRFSSVCATHLDFLHPRAQQSSSPRAYLGSGFELARWDEVGRDGGRKHRNVCQPAS